MTEFESQLRKCLTRHAQAAEQPLGLLTAARTRSRQLSRRHNTATVAAVVPVTAAVVLGAAAMTGSLPSGRTSQVQPGTSISPSPVPTACASGTMANVAITGTDQQPLPIKPGTVSLSLPNLAGLTSRPHSVVEFSAFDSARFLVSGNAAATDQRLLEAVVRNKDKSLTDLWFVEQRTDTTDEATEATFLGCVTTPAR